MTIRAIVFLVVMVIVTVTAIAAMGWLAGVGAAVTGWIGYSIGTDQDIA